MTINRADGFIPRKNYFAAAPSFVRSKLLQHGLDPDIALPLAQGLQGIFNKFAIDERLNYDVIENNLGGVGSGDAQVVIASASTVLGHRTADYVCDGAADEEEFNAAIQDVYDNGGAGRILALEGEYFFEDSITSLSGVDASNVWLQGSGPGTFMQGDTGVSIIALGDADGHSQDAWKISDFYFISGANGIVTSIDKRHLINNCWFNDLTGSAISLNDGGFTIITDCHFLNMGTNGIIVSNCSGVQIIGNQFDGGASTAMLNLGTIDSAIVVGNYITNTDDVAIYVDSASYGVIASNHILTPAGHGIQWDTSPFDGIDMTIINNRILEGGDHGIIVAPGFGKLVDSKISGNHIQNCQKTGISVAGGFGESDDFMVTDNHIIDCGSATGTWAGIHLEGQLNRTFVHGNKIVGETADYGVDIADGGVTDTIVANNDIRLGYVTTKINDLGTATVLNMDGGAGDWNPG